MGCQVRDLPVLGLKVKPLYLRDIESWSRLHDRKPSYWRHLRYPVILRRKSDHYGAKISLRGDLARHWRGVKKSWRVWMEPGSFYEGLSEFDLVIPEDKSAELEPIGYALGQDLGLLTPRWSFVRLVLNNLDAGPYLLVERWNRQSFELRGLPEGEILLEANAWLDSIGEKASPYQNVYAKQDRYNELALELAIYKVGIGGLYQGEALRSFGEMLSGMKKELQSKDIANWDKRLDKEQFASWLALMIFLGSTHGVLGENIRWFYHPLRQNFRPIPYDFLPSRLATSVCPLVSLATMNPWIKLFIRDKSNLILLRRAIHRLIKPGVIERIFASFDQVPGHRSITSFESSQRRRGIIFDNRLTLQKWITAPNCL